MLLRCLVIIGLLFAAAVSESPREWLSCPVLSEQRTQNIKIFFPRIPDEVKYWQGNVERNPQGMPIAYYIYTAPVNNPAPCSRSSKAQAQRAVPGLDVNRIENLPQPPGPVKRALWNLFQPVMAWATSITDSFVRANEDPLSDGGKWDVYSGITALEIVSNVIRCTAVDGADCFQTRNDHVPTDDQYASLTLPTLNSSNDGTSNTAGVILRYATPDTNEGYQFLAREGGSAGKTWILNAPDYVIIAENSTQWADGDTLQGRADGTSLYIFRNGVLELSGSDATYTSGRCGAAIWLNTINSVADIEGSSFVCGDLADLTGTTRRKARSGIHTIQ